MGENQPPRRTSSLGVFLGVLIGLAAAGVVALIVWVISLHGRVEALSGSASQGQSAVSSQAQSGVAPQEEVVAGQQPPAPQVEVPPAAPGPEVDFCWIGGWWWWQGGAWAWHPGYWARRPHPGALWVPHVWMRGPRGWVHSGGRWH